MSRTGKALMNVLSTAGYQIIAMLVGIIIPKILLSEYGSEVNGLISSISQFIAYFSLVEAGIANAATYALYKPLAEKNYERINCVISAAKRFYFQSGYWFVLLVILMALIYPMFVSVSSLSPFLVGILIIVLGSKGFLDFFTLSKYRVLLTADQKTYIVYNSSSIYLILQMLIIILLAKLHCNVVIVYSIAILALCVRSLILYLYVKKRYKKLNYKKEFPKNILDKRWDALYLQILQTVQTGVPVIFATIFTSLKTVSVYSVFNMILTGINGILSVFINGISSTFGEIIAKKEDESLRKAYSDFEWLYYMLIIVVYSVSFIMIMPFVNIYTNGINDANYNQPLIGFLFVLNGLLYSLKNPQGALVLSAGAYKETRVQVTIQALIIILLGLILTPKFGIAGILIASCVSNFYRDIDLGVFVPKNITKTSVFNTLKRMLLVLFTIAIIYIPNVIFDFSLNISSFFEWIIMSIIYMLYSTIILTVISLVFEKKQMMSIIKRFKRILKKSY